MIKMNIIKQGILLLLLISLASTAHTSCDKCRFKNGTHYHGPSDML